MPDFQYFSIQLYNYYLMVKTSIATAKITASLFPSCAVTSSWLRERVALVPSRIASRLSAAPASPDIEVTSAEYPVFPSFHHAVGAVAANVA